MLGRERPLKSPKNLQLPTACHCHTAPPVIAALDAAMTKGAMTGRRQLREAKRRSNPVYIPKCIFSIWYVKTKKNVAII